jgi:NADPH2:quinone reductase
MSSEQTMLAAVLDTHGAPFRVTTIARPSAAPGQVLVRVAASGVNPIDTKIHQGQAPHARHGLPAVLGLDLAGTVEALGEGVTRFRRGDEVYGMTGGVAGVQGSLAQFAAVDADLLAAKPANLTMREAAALPLVFITAWEGLVDRAALRAGETVLVLGGAGGVGHVAIQLARALSANVFATASPAKAALIERLGAAAIDRDLPIEDVVARYADGRGFAVVYDCVGGAVLDAAFKAVRVNGRVVSALGWGTHSLAPLSFRAASYAGIFTLLPLLTGEGRAHHGDILREATRFAEAGQLAPTVDPRRFDLNSIGDAYAIQKDGGANSKLVIEIAEAV